MSEEGAARRRRAKLDRLRENGDTVRLSGAEFTSYIRFRMADRFATGDIELPVVNFEGETVKVAGRLPKDRIPESQLRQLGGRRRLHSRHGGRGRGREAADAGTRPRARSR